MFKKLPIQLVLFCKDVYAFLVSLHNSDDSLYNLKIVVYRFIQQSPVSHPKNLSVYVAILLIVYHFP